MKITTVRQFEILESEIKKNPSYGKGKKEKTGISGKAAKFS